MSTQDDSVGVVIDAGTSSTKAGFAYEASPRSVIPTTVGRFRRAGLIDGIPLIYCGKEAVRRQGISNLVWPVQNGLIKDWDEMEKLWHHIYYKELHVPPEMSKTIHTVHALVPRKDKERMVEILFESFTVQALYLVKTPVAVLHASGRTSGLVWESGSATSHVTPVFEGFPLKHAVTSSLVTGNFLTDRLQILMSELGYSFTTTIERSILERIKAEMCYVAQDYAVEQELFSSSGDNKKIFDLPDGQQIILGKERFECPECIFRPSLNDNINSLGLTELVCNSISRCDIDYKYMFYNNIVVSGGTSMFPGLVERLLMELKRVPKTLADVDVKIDALPFRKFAAWSGGSVMASLNNLNGFWMTRNEYEDLVLMGFDKPAIVIDNGSYIIKAGFACDNHPVSMFRSVVGRPVHLKGSYGREYYDVFIGDEAISKNGDLDLNRPIVKGRINNWDNMERIWHHIFYRELKAAPEDRAVILGCAVTTPMSEKIKCCEVFFETLNVPGFCIQSQGVLALYGSGYTTGISLDLGYDTTDICPIYEGGLVTYAHMQTQYAGEQITHLFRNSLKERNYDFGNQTAEIIEGMKKSVYVTRDIAMQRNNYKKMYKLPSGEKIDVSQEVFIAGETMFSPQLFQGNDTEVIPLQTAIAIAASKCDSELRSELYDAIVPCGGLAMIPGLNSRLAEEVEQLVHRPVNLVTSSEAYAVPWLGGATFAGTSASEKIWITKKQYDDHGVKIIKNKFM